MDHKTYNETLARIPEHIRKQYGLMFHELGYDKEETPIITNEYKYYPKHATCVINEIEIIWEKEKTWVTPENKEILKTFKQRVNNQLRPGLCTVYVNDDGSLACREHNNNPRVKAMIKRNGCTATMTIDNRTIYYNPNNIDLPNEPLKQHIAQCLFYAARHKYIGIDAVQNEHPSEWMALHFIKNLARKLLLL